MGADRLTANALAVLVFIFAAVVSKADAFSSPLFLAEGSTLPVFPVRDADQMQVELVDEHAAFAGDGQPLDYRSDLVIYERGEQVKALHVDRQLALLPQRLPLLPVRLLRLRRGLEVRDRATGNVLYRETVALSDTTPLARSHDSRFCAAVLLEGSVVLTESLDADGVEYDGALITLPGGRTPHDRLAPDRRQAMTAQLVVVEPGGGADTVNATLGEGRDCRAPAVSR